MHQHTRPSFLRSSITLELLNLLLNATWEPLFIGLFVPVPLILMLAISNWASCWAPREIQECKKDCSTKFYMWRPDLPVFLVQQNSKLLQNVAYLLVIHPPDLYAYLLVSLVRVIPANPHHGCIGCPQKSLEDCQIGPVELASVFCPEKADDNNKRHQLC